MKPPQALSLRYPLARRLARATRWLALPLLVAACRTTEAFHEPGSLLARAAPLGVTLSDELRGLKARTGFASAKTSYLVGNLLARLFPATDGEYFLSYVDSTLEVSGQPPDSRTRYTLVLALQHAGKYHLIQAEGTSSAGEWPTPSGRQAIELCISDVHAQTAAILRATAP